MGKIYTRVAGVTYTNEDGTERQDILQSLHEGDNLYLVDEGDFEHPEAIGVYDGSEQVGFLPKSLATQVREYLSDGELIDCDVIIDYIGAKRSDLPLGCRIAISHVNLPDDIYEEETDNGTDEADDEIERNLRSIQIQKELLEARYKEKMAEVEQAKKTGSGCATVFVIAILGIGAFGVYKLLNWLGLL